MSRFTQSISFNKFVESWARLGDFNMVKIHNILAVIQFKPTQKVTSLINFQEDKVSRSVCAVWCATQIGRESDKPINCLIIWRSRAASHHNIHTKIGVQEKWQPMLDSHQTAVKLKQRAFSLWLNWICDPASLRYWKQKQHVVHYAFYGIISDI